MRPGNLTLTLNDFEDVLRQVSASTFLRHDKRFRVTLLVCFTAWIVPLLLFRGFVRRPDSSWTPPELSALQKIMVPTSSRWNLSSRQLVAHPFHQTIWKLWSTVSGDVELRQLPRDLPDPLSSSVLVDGWGVRLHVHLLDRFHAILWTTLARFFDVRGHVLATVDCLESPGRC